MVVVAGCAALFLAGGAQAQDWPQWRGASRDGKAAGFTAPKTWPKELPEKWKTTVGEGVATPALVGDKLYVFARQDGNEITRCLDAATGREVWQDKYESLGATAPAQNFSGPRSSPTVVDGKVVTLGVRGMISCLDAATGKPLWRKDEFKAYPRFFPSSSPVVVNGLCIAQLGGQDNGALVAYDLATGEQKWKWAGDTPGYASPMLMKVGGAQLIIAETERRLVAVNAADGKLAWETPYAVQGRGYNASTPIVNGETLIFCGSGRGTRAVKFEKTAEGFSGKELWSNTDKSVQFNTPVVKDGLLYGLSAGNEFFCLNVTDGKIAWTAPLGKGEEAQPGPSPGGTTAAAGGGTGGGGPGGGPGGRGSGRGMGGMGGGGYGSIVDAGSVLLALTPAAELVAFEPGDKAYTEVARIKVADGQTYAYPVVSGSRIFVKDRDSVTLRTIE